jgi:hypothetical protein
MFVGSSLHTSILVRYPTGMALRCDILAPVIGERVLTIDCFGLHKFCSECSQFVDWVNDPEVVCNQAGTLPGSFLQSVRPLQPTIHARVANQDKPLKAGSLYNWISAHIPWTEYQERITRPRRPGARGPGNTCSLSFYLPSSFSYLLLQVMTNVKGYQTRLVVTVILSFEVASPSFLSQQCHQLAVKGLLDHSTA